MAPAYENISREELVTMLIESEKCNETLNARLEELTFQVKELIRLVHGAKSERFVSTEALVATQLSPVTINDWITACYDLLQPLYDLLKREVLSQLYLQVDQTPIKVLDKDKKGSTHTGYHWLYHAPLTGMALFDYQPSRGGEGPEHLLKDFKGHLQTDGYGVYENFDNKEGITQIQCMAHARRMFEKALDNHPQLASYALTQIQQLYAIERKAKDLSLNYDERYTLRQKEAVPLLTAFNVWLIAHMPRQEKTPDAVLPSTTMGKAVNYALGRWHQLMIYAHHGELHIDNNAAENAIRPIALGYAK